MTSGFVFSSAALGVGLAMDAFSVSLANGLHEPRMKRGRMCLIAGTFAVFQYAMPMIGWACVHTIAAAFTGFQKMIPWIALILLLYIGGKMLLEGLRERRQTVTEEIKETGDRELSPDSLKNGQEGKAAASSRDLCIQGIATSIDALSVGFTIAGYSAGLANLAALIIGGVTFAICIGGLMIGRQAGTRLSWKAAILGGIILITIGVKIFWGGV